MSVHADHPAGDRPGGLSGAPGAVPAATAGTERVVAGALLRARHVVRRLAPNRALGVLRDPVVLGGAVLLGIGVAIWRLEHLSNEFIDLQFDAPLALAGAMLLAGRLAARRARHEAAYMSVIQAASARMSRATTVAAVGRAVVEETGRMIDYHNARVYVLEPPDQVVPIAFEGRVGAYERVDMALLRTRLGAGFTGWVAEHGVPLLVGDANRDPRGATIPGTDEVDESMLVVPMRYDERTVGVITLSKLGLDQFDAGDLRLLSILADQAATALETARLLARSDGLAAELRRLVDMGSALSQSLDPRQVADLMAQHLAQAAGVERCDISYWDRLADRTVTMGTFPAGRIPDDLYSLADFPETRRVLTEQVVVRVHVDDPRADPAERRYLEAAGMQSAVMLPLVAKGASIGLVELAAAGRLGLEPSTLELLWTMANEAAMALENAVLYERARTLADHDPVTGFYNHRYFQERLGEELLRASRTRRPVALLMLDLDDFKLVNDTFGHLLGDRVLAWTAELIHSTLRGSDVPARYGGDEFAVILPDTDRAAAVRAAERIVEAFRSHAFQAESRGPVPIGISIGVASHPADGQMTTALISAADDALYRSKHGGGNRITSAEPAPETGTAGPAAGSVDRRSYHRNRAMAARTGRSGAGRTAE